jgi:hypothetical protein
MRIETSHKGFAPSKQLRAVLMGQIPPGIYAKKKEKSSHPSRTLACRINYEIPVSGKLPDRFQDSAEGVLQERRVYYKRRSNSDQGVGVKGPSQDNALIKTSLHYVLRECCIS